MYDRLGRAAIRFAFVYLRRRYSRAIRVGLVLLGASIGVAAYLASRNVPEG